jgi:hypothetical protein
MKQRLVQKVLEEPGLIIKRKMFLLIPKLESQASFSNPTPKENHVLFSSPSIPDYEPL